MAAIHHHMENMNDDQHMLGNDNIVLSDICKHMKAVDDVHQMHENPKCDVGKHWPSCEGLQ